MSKVVIAGDASGTGTFTISAPNGNTDRTLVLPDEAGTVLTSASGIPASQLTGVVPQKGVPAFRAYKATNQTVSANTNTKAIFDTTEFNVGNGWDTTNNRFKPTIAGYYQINWQIANNTQANYYLISYLWLNGGAKILAGSRVDAANSYCSVGSTTLYLNGTTDYVEIYGYMSATVFTSYNEADLACLASGFLVSAA